MINSWLGLIMGTGCILLGQLLEGGHINSLIQPTAALIVFGGTLGATLLSSSLGDFIAALRAIQKVLLGGNPDFGPLVKEITGIATSARREGILGLEGQLGRIKNHFFAENLRHVIDGYDPAVLREMLEDRIGLEEEHKMAIAKVYETAGGFSPTVGILGAVLGLIHVMANLSDSSKLGSGIAVAFVATVYGVGLANLVLLPIGNKLKSIFHTEIMEMNLIASGLIGIQTGLNPRIIEERLQNLLGEHGGGEEKKAA